MQHDIMQCACITQVVPDFQGPVPLVQRVATEDDFQAELQEYNKRREAAHRAFFLKDHGGIETQEAAQACNRILPLGPQCGAVLCYWCRS